MLALGKYSRRSTFNPIPQTNLSSESGSSAFLSRSTGFFRRLIGRWWDAEDVRETRCQAVCSVSNRCAGCTGRSMPQGGALYDSTPLVYRRLALLLTGMRAGVSQVRKVCYRIVDDRKFDFCILSLIVISSAFMAYEHPRVSTCHMHRNVCRCLCS